MDIRDPRTKKLQQLKKTLKRLSAQVATLCGNEGAGPNQQSLLAMQQIFGAEHYYREQGFILDHADGCYVWDMAGKKYLDCIALYSAIASGHGNIELIGAMLHQLFRMTGAPNRFVNDMQPQLLAQITALTHQDGAILMNTGAEAFDTAVKGARQWAYQVKGVRSDRAAIISAQGNFHGRTLAAIAASATEKYRTDFGPFPPGFKKVPYADIEALKKTITPNTAAFIVEPIQGEGGIVVPPSGYLEAVRTLCTKKNVLLIFDEIQTGLGRTGKLFAGEWSGVHADGILLGKALGAYMPVSAFAARHDIVKCFTPGRHGSTFGGTALSCATALKSLELIVRDDLALVKNSANMGEYFLAELLKLRSPAIKDVRGKGLFVGMELDKNVATADQLFMKLKKHGLISGVAGNNTVRFTPPLVINKSEIDLAVQCIAKAAQEL